MHEGWIKLYRKTMDSRVFQNGGLLKVWIWCLLKANYQDRIWMPVRTGKGTTEVQVKRGSFIFGRNEAARELKMEGSSVRNRMQKLKSIGNLDIQTDRHYSVVSIMNWDTYPGTLSEGGQAKGQTEDNQRISKGQPKDTNKNLKNEKNEEKNNIVDRGQPSGPPSYPVFKEKRKDIPYEEIIDVLNRESGKGFKADSRATRSLIRGRWQEGFRFEDFKRVIEKKCRDWKGDEKMDNFLRPSTLFRASNFESYLNEKENGQMSGPKNKQKSKLWGTGYPKFHNHDGETFGFKCPRCNKLVWSDDHPCLQTEEAKQAQEMAKKFAKAKAMPKKKRFDVEARMRELRRQAEQLKKEAVTPA